MTTAPTPQPEALRLAAWLNEGAWNHMRLGDVEAAGRELKRLHAENECLRGDYALRGAQIQRMAALIDELEGKVGRFQGIPLPLIEAINAATGSNDWQGDHSPAELLEPACRAIAELEARKPLPPVEAIKLGMEAQQTCRPHGTGTTNWAFAITRFYKRRLVDKSLNLQEPLVDKTANLQDRPTSLIASREVIADGPIRVTRLNLTDEGRAGLTSKATGPLPSITGGSS